jgi:hypothetical protein
MPLESIGLPRVKLLEHRLYGRVVALECLCGDPVPYPGVGGADNPIACVRCGQHFHAVPPETLREQTFVPMDER